MSRDCCSWDGVICDDMTGHVIELDLGCSGLVGTIHSNSRHFQLSHFQRLDLSNSDFLVATKGFDREIVRILYLYTVIDLSSNKFGGRIPSIMGDLIAVHILNLSQNGLLGHIPPSFKDLSSAESLDLSVNQLSGEIPQQLISLTSLSFLNLS
uniref:Hcr2-0A n=1 Tax=Solanum tuberosum TaxID=4113 RepID=M1BZP4_SOLTU